MTDCWQPIGVGSIVQLINNIFRMEQEYWMDLTHTRDDGAEEPNWKRWDRGLSASERRVLVTWWLGEAYEKVCGPKYKPAVHRAWAMGGCLAALPTSKPYVKGHGHLDTNFTEPFSDTTYFDQHFTGSPNFVCVDFVPEPMDGGEEKDEEEDDTSDSADSDSSSTAVD